MRVISELENLHTGGLEASHEITNHKSNRAQQVLATLG